MSQKLTESAEYSTKVYSTEEKNDNIFCQNETPEGWLLNTSNTDNIPQVKTPTEDSNLVPEQCQLNSLQELQSDSSSSEGRLSKLLMFLLSFCLPTGGALNQQGPSSGNCRPILVCLPSGPTMRKPAKEDDDDQYKPIGLVTRNKDADFIGGKFISKCTCGRRDGLGGSDCPRISCQNNPGCLMNPPRCWPQIRLPKEPPPPPPDQNMICVPIELVYYDPTKQKK